MRFETPRLLLFLFRTRFSREFLFLLTLFMFFTAILPRYFPPDIHRLFSSQGRYTFAFAFAFATAANGMRGGGLPYTEKRPRLSFLPSHKHRKNLGLSHHHTILFLRGSIHNPSGIFWHDRRRSVHSSASFDRLIRRIIRRKKKVSSLSHHIL